LSNSEKELLERSAVLLFIDRYNKIFNDELKLFSLGDKPDSIITNARGEKVGIEIAHLFYDAEEAKYTLGRGNTNSKKILRNYILSLNAILIKKEKKWQDYLCHCCHCPVWLLIRSASQLLSYEIIEAYKKDLYIPPQSYEHIWLLLDNPDMLERWTTLVMIK